MGGAFSTERGSIGTTFVAFTNLATAGVMCIAVTRLAQALNSLPSTKARPAITGSPQTLKPQKAPSFCNSPAIKPQKDPYEKPSPNFGTVTSFSQLPELGPSAYAVQHEESTNTGRRPSKSVIFDRQSSPFDQRSPLVIRDSTEAVAAMKSVFKRLCRSSSELISAEDVVKVHSLLGEPMDQEEEGRLLEYVGSKSSSDRCISFETFMGWWSQLHDSSADPDEYYSQERYRQRFKVLQSRLKDPNIAHIQTKEEGDIASRRYRVHFEIDGEAISPWHDIPLKNPDGSYNFVCEIPKWTRKKFEIATGEAMNPIKQDVKNGVLREYKWGDMLFNYGAFPQTWEDPKHVDDETGCPGDNDPIDVIELGTRQRPVGSITRVKIVGIIAMIDSDETDWKVLAVACDDDMSANINDLADLNAHMPGVLGALTHWLRMYKTADGKSENRFGCGDKPQGAAFATRIVDETHKAWRQLLAEKSKEGSLIRKGKVGSLADISNMTSTNMIVGAAIGA